MHFIVGAHGGGLLTFTIVIHQEILSIRSCSMQKEGDQGGSIHGRISPPTRQFREGGHEVNV